MKIQARFWIEKGGRSYLGNGRIALLKWIAQEGSIAKSAKRMKMSYKSAWDNLNQIKDLSGTPLITSSNGGIGGGGTSLTAEGEKAIMAFEYLQNVGSEFFALFDGCENLDELQERLEKVERFLKTFEK